MCILLKFKYFYQNKIELKTHMSRLSIKQSICAPRCPPELRRSLMLATGPALWCAGRLFDSLLGCIAACATNLLPLLQHIRLGPRKNT